MSRKIKTLCNVYTSKAEILEEWGTGVDEGTLAVGKKYIEQREMSEHYEFRSSEHQLCYFNKIEVETVKDIFRMNMFGISLNGICISLVEYQNPVPIGINHWNTEIIKEIFKDERFAGYQFIFEEETVLVMQVGIAIIPKRIFALTQELNITEEVQSQQERLKRLRKLLL